METVRYRLNIVLAYLSSDVAENDELLLLEGRLEPWKAKILVGDYTIRAAG